MNKIIVACSALALSSIVTIHAQKKEPDWRSVGDLRLNGAPLEAKVVTGQPYSAEIVSESVQTLADGNRIVQRTTGRVFRDGQGRVRREEDRPSGGPSISIMDPTRGVTIVLDSVNRTARETPTGLSIELKKLKDLAKMAEALNLAAEKRAAEGPPQDVERRKVELGDAERRKVEVLINGGRATGFVRTGGEKLDETTEEKLPDRMIEGVWASGVRRTTTIPKGVIGNEQPIKVVSEEWTSPDLQVLVLTDRTDPRAGHSTYRLLRVGLNEPDPSLFQVPPDYTRQGTAGRGARGAPGAGGNGERGARGR